MKPESIAYKDKKETLDSPGKRLNHILDNAGFIQGRGRISQLHYFCLTNCDIREEELAVSTVRGWFAESLPKPQRMIKIIDELDNEFDLNIEIEKIIYFWSGSGEDPFNRLNEIQQSEATIIGELVDDFYDIDIILAPDDLVKHIAIENPKKCSSIEPDNDKYSFETGGERFNHILDKIGFETGHGRISTFYNFLTVQTDIRVGSYSTVRSWFLKNSPPLDKISRIVEALDKEFGFTYLLDPIKVYWKLNEEYPFVDKNSIDNITENYTGSNVVKKQLKKLGVENNDAVKEFCQAFALSESKTLPYDKIIENFYQQHKNIQEVG